MRYKIEQSHCIKRAVGTEAFDHAVDLALTHMVTLTQDRNDIGHLIASLVHPLVVSIQVKVAPVVSFGSKRLQTIEHLFID